MHACLSRFWLLDLEYVCLYSQRGALLHCACAMSEDMSIYGKRKFDEESNVEIGNLHAVA